MNAKLRTKLYDRLLHTEIHLRHRPVHAPECGLRHQCWHTLLGEAGQRLGLGKLDCVHKSPGNLEKLKILTQYIWGPCCASSVPESSPTLCNPMDCSPSGSSVHVISQARKLEWVTIPFPRGSSDPGMEPQSPALAGRFFTAEPLGKPHTQLTMARLTKSYNWN